MRLIIVCIKIAQIYIRFTIHDIPLLPKDGLVSLDRITATILIVVGRTGLTLNFEL